MPGTITPDARTGVGVEIPIDIDTLRSLAPHLSTPLALRVLRGVSLISDGASVELTATDGFRMAIYREEIARPKVTTIIPPELVKAMLRAKQSGTLTITPAKLTWHAGGSGTPTAVGQPIPGTFPHYHQLIPAPPHKTIVSVNRRQLLAAVVAAAKDTKASVKEQAWMLDKLAKRELESEGSRVRFEAANGALGIETRLSGATMVSASLAAGVEGDANKIAFTSKYLIEALKSLSGETVTISLTDPVAPALFEDGGPLLVVVMPMFVDW